MKSILSPKRGPGRPPKTSTPVTNDPPPKFTPRGESSKSRILVAVKEGRIDFKAMSPDAAKSLNELMHTADVQAQFGIGPLTEGFDPKHCKRLFQGLGIVFAGLGRRVMKMPAEAADKLLYTDAEQEELSKPTAAVLDELAPRWIRENQSIVALLTVFTAMTQNKFQEAAALTVAIRRATVVHVAPTPTAGDPRVRVVIPLNQEQTNGGSETIPPHIG